METAAPTMAAHGSADEPAPALERLARRLTFSLVAIELAWLSAIGYGLAELLH